MPDPHATGSSAARPRICSSCSGSVVVKRVDGYPLFWCDRCKCHTHTKERMPDPHATPDRAAERQRIYEQVEPYLLALRAAVSRADYDTDRADLHALFDVLDGLGEDDSYMTARGALDLGGERSEDVIRRLRGPIE